MATTTRPYLRADARRRQLLDAASRLFARDGLAGMTMVALAAEARVSRRLVYDHFADLGALYDAFFDDRFARYVAAIDQAIDDADGDVVVAFDGAFTRLLAMPADDQRAVRLVVAGTGIPELEAVRDRFRARVEARWLPFLGAVGARPDDRSRALLWVLVTGFLALADSVSRGDVAADVATSLAVDLVRSVPRVTTVAAGTP